MHSVGVTIWHVYSPSGALYLSCGWFESPRGADSRDPVVTKKGTLS
jgi:hypothetical protein